MGRYWISIHDRKLLAKQRNTFAFIFFYGQFKLSIFSVNINNEEISVGSQRNLKPFGFENVFAIFAKEKSLYTPTLITCIFVSEENIEIV